MRTITIISLFLSAAILATGGVNSLGVIYYQGFPLPWFCDIGLIFILLRLRRELDNELEQHRQSEA